VRQLSDRVNNEKDSPSKVSPEKTLKTMQTEQSNFLDSYANFTNIEMGSQLGVTK